MRVKIIVRNNPPTSELKHYQKFADENWSEHDVSQNEEDKNFFDIPKTVILAYSKNKLVGLLNIHIKQGRVGKTLFSLGGIGGVVTDKEFRRLGIATKILKKAVLEMKILKLDVSMLCTNIEQLGQLYKNVGFEPVGREYFFYDINGKLQKETGGMIAKVTSKNIFNTILKTKDVINVGNSNF